MATAALAERTIPAEHYLNQEFGIKSWLLTKDHKRIGILYLLSITLFFFVGGFFAVMIRLNLLTPDAALGIFIAGFSSILTGLNFIVTIHRMRAPGLTWFRLPLFVWATYATALIQVLGTPVIAITLVLVALERAFHIGIFDPAWGGDPVLFQHMFWFYSHPAVYIMILPGMGVISELIATFSRKPIFGYKFVAFSAWPSRCLDSSCGRTTCLSPAFRFTRRWCFRS